jgi:MFS family permease
MTNEASDAVPATGNTPAPPTTVQASAWLAVLIFCVAQIISTIDRGMLSLVIDPVRAALHISDVQIALLLGFAFALFYVTVGLPLGMAADRVNRRRLLLVGIVIWSLATISGGYAQNFSQMFGSRLFIGIGEAVLGPCAVTMIGDLFPVAQRGRPMAVYVYGTMIAYGLGSLISGYVLQWAPLGVFDAIVPLRGLAPWRIAFILVGSCGFAVAALMLLLREPRRQNNAGEASVANSLRAIFAQFSSRRRLYLPLYGSLATFAMGGAAASGWGAVLLTRNFGISAASAGKGLGTGQILWATLGALLASVIVDQVARRAGSAGKVKLAGALAVCAIPSCLAGLTDSSTMAMAQLSEVMFVSALYGTTMLSVIMEVAPGNARGFAVALYAFVMTMIGGSLGPLGVAFLTQHVFHNPSAVGWSMAIVGTVALCVSAALSIAAAAALPRYSAEPIAQPNVPAKPTAVRAAR